MRTGVAGVIRKSRRDDPQSFGPSPPLISSPCPSCGHHPPPLPSRPCGRRIRNPRPFASTRPGSPEKDGSSGCFVGVEVGPEFSSFSKPVGCCNAVEKEQAISLLSLKTHIAACARGCFANLAGRGYELLGVSTSSMLLFLLGTLRCRDLCAP